MIEKTDLLTYYYNMWKNNKLTFENPDNEDKFLNAVCISRFFNSDVIKYIPEDVKMHGDAIIERELKKVKRSYWSRTMNLDEDIKRLEEYAKFHERLLSYLKELRLFRMREIMNVEIGLNSVKSQLQSNKADLEEHKRLTTLREMNYFRKGD